MPLSLFRSAPRLADGMVIEVAGVPVRLRVSDKASRVSIRIDAARGEAVATAPSARRLREAADFAHSRARWIAERLDALPSPRPFRPGATIPLRGAPCRLERAAMRIPPRLAPATGAEPVRLIASGDDEAFSRAVARKLKAEAAADLRARTAFHAARLGRPCPPVQVADARGRWGSCRGPAGGDDGLIRYNWRLVCAPPRVLDYVAAHEVAHLEQPNHSPAFWAVVARLYGDCAREKAWLRREGAALHALGRG